MRHPFRHSNGKIITTALLLSSFEQARRHATSPAAIFAVGICWSGAIADMALRASAIKLQ
jgi:hypothetical protein